MRRRAAYVLMLAAALSACDRTEAPVQAPASPEKAAVTPSFDCSGTVNTTVEELVCSDAELAAADRRLDAVWQTAGHDLTVAEQGQLRAEQRGWVKGRDDCWKAEDVRDCVLYSYRSRTAELEIHAGIVQPFAESRYRCEGEDDAVAISWYSDTEPPAARVSVGDDRSLTFLSRAASGARYAAPGVVAWEHQGALTLEWFGREIRCEKLDDGAS